MKGVETKGKGVLSRRKGEGLTPEGQKSILAWNDPHMREAPHG